MLILVYVFSLLSALCHSLECLFILYICEITITITKLFNSYYFKHNHEVSIYNTPGLNLHGLIVE